MLQDINNTTGHVVEIGCLLEIDGTKHSQVGLRAHITADLWNEKSCLNLISHILKHSACHPLWQTSSFMHVGTGWKKPKLFVEALNRQVCILWEMCQRAICCQGLFGCFILDQTSEGVELLLIEVNPKQIMAPATYFYLMLVPSRSASAQMGQFHFSGFILSFELFLSSASISVSDFHGIWMTSSISEIGQYLVGVNAGCSMPVIAPSAFCLPRRASKAGEKKI